MSLPFVYSPNTTSQNIPTSLVATKAVSSPNSQPKSTKSKNKSSRPLRTQRSRRYRTGGRRRRPIQPQDTWTTMINYMTPLSNPEEKGEKKLIPLNPCFMPIFQQGIIQSYTLYQWKWVRFSWLPNCSALSSGSITAGLIKEGKVVDDINTLTLTGFTHAIYSPTSKTLDQKVINPFPLSIDSEIGPVLELIQDHEVKDAGRIVINGLCEFTKPREDKINAVVYEHQTIADITSRRISGTALIEGDRATASVAAHLGSTDVSFSLPSFIKLVKSGLPVIVKTVGSVLKYIIGDHEFPLSATDMVALSRPSNDDDESTFTVFDIEPITESPSENTEEVEIKIHSATTHNYPTVYTEYNQFFLLPDLSLEYLLPHFAYEILDDQGSAHPVVTFAVPDVGDFINLSFSDISIEVDSVESSGSVSLLGYTIGGTQMFRDKLKEIFISLGISESYFDNTQLHFNRVASAANGDPMEVSMLTNSVQASLVYVAPDTGLYCPYGFTATDVVPVVSGYCPTSSVGFDTLPVVGKVLQVKSDSIQSQQIVSAIPVGYEFDKKIFPNVPSLSWSNRTGLYRVYVVSSNSTPDLYFGLLDDSSINDATNINLLNTYFSKLSPEVSVETRNLDTAVRGNNTQISLFAGSSPATAIQLFL